MIVACGGSGTPPETTASKRPPTSEPTEPSEPLARAKRPAKRAPTGPRPLGARRKQHPPVVAYAEMRPLVSSIKPGRPFWLALHMVIHDGYRVSWTYPGDLGREIRVKFTGPEGFGIGRVVYPAPKRFTVGEHEAFGWEKETAAFVRVTPPRRLSGQDAYRFDVEADWLACEAECLRESTKAYLELTSSWSGGASSGDEALETLLALVPKPFSGEKDATHEWVAGPRVPRVNLTIDGVRLSEFIPATEASRKGVTAKVLDDGAKLVLEYEDPPGPPPHTTYGVLLGMRGEKRASYEVEIPWIDIEDRGRKK